MQEPEARHRQGFCFCWWFFPIIDMPFFEVIVQDWSSLKSTSENTATNIPLGDIHYDFLHQKVHFRGLRSLGFIQSSILSIWSFVCWSDWLFVCLFVWLFVWLFGRSACWGPHCKVIGFSRLLAADFWFTLIILSLGEGFINYLDRTMW